MTLLLDTHVFLWFCQGDSRLSSTAKSLIEDPSNAKLLSVASCWEIAIKAGVKKLTLGEPASVYISNALARSGVAVLPITLEHVTSVETLPTHHKDPFDRLFVGQVQAEGLTLVSADPIFDVYGIQRVL